MHHFLFGCPAYSDVRPKHASLFQQAFSVSDFFTNSKSNACGGSLNVVVHVEHLLYSPDMSLSAFSCVVFCLLAPCRSPGPKKDKS